LPLNLLRHPLFLPPGRLAGSILLVGSVLIGPVWTGIVCAQSQPLSSAPGGETSIFDLAREKRQWQEDALSRELDPLARIQLRIAAGNPVAPQHEITSAQKLGLAGEIALLQLAFAQHDLDEIEKRLRAWGTERTLRGFTVPPPTGTPDELQKLERELLYRWDFLIADLLAVEKRCGRIEDPTPTAWEDVLARAELAFRTIHISRSRRLFREALRWASSPRDRSRALYGLARVDYNDLDFADALAKLEESLKLSPLFADAWHQYGLTLIRVGRTSEAIASFALATELVPNHEGAHYALGNGYAMETYTQLFAKHSDRFLEPHSQLSAADSLLRIGQKDEAEASYGVLVLDYPDRADLHARFGSLAFADRDWTSARVRFTAALDLVPTYGRAHNGLAKSLEAERLAKDPLRTEHEKAFAETPLPDLPGIEEYVINWYALTSRHQKRVALSVAPWGRYLPALLAGGATHYIKPLHERLSETPGQTTLADARISYDSRLWDDVRGCGGHHTVTGIEDVERSIVGHYNTVLHELTHQVHGILPAARTAQIDDLYWRTKARDDDRGSAFLSRYAGGSVWEYFAEGANSLMTPTRGRLDTREITGERLAEIDPELRQFVVELMDRGDIDSCFAVAFVAKGEEELRAGNTTGALESMNAALERNPDEPAALRGRTEALLRAGQTKDARTAAERASARFPEDGELAILATESLLLSGLDLNEVLDDLRSRRLKVRTDDRPSLDLALGLYAWLAGDAELSLDSYERALSVRQDDPNGLWGRASAHALGNNFAAAWTDYESAVQLRTGILELRCDYARDLLRAEEIDRAREQIDAALLLDAGSPRARTLLAWWHLKHGDLRTAAKGASEALEEDPDLDLARLIVARSSEEHEWLAELVEEETIPSYAFDPRRGSYRLVGLRSELTRQLLQEWFPERHNSDPIGN